MLRYVQLEIVGLVHEKKPLLEKFGFSLEEIKRCIVSKSTKSHINSVHLAGKNTDDHCRQILEWAFSPCIVMTCALHASSVLFPVLKLLSVSKHYI